jgi:acyl transferase domain-containing protein
MEIHEVLDRALAQLKSIRERRTEPLAIIGMGCRFPGASSPEAFWKLLAQGRCEIRETPADRWDSVEFAATGPGQKGRITSGQGSYLDDVDQFDAPFFNLSGREANLMDPQQRLLLEVAWETLENAGINPNSTKGSSTGVYVGICSSDYLHLVTRHNPLDLDAWVSTGNAHGSAAGRLSYVFDWRGPCVAVDTACSSSLVALHMAVQALRNDECRAAFVAGVNLMLAPDLSISLSQAGMLSPEGRCKTFSEAANGFVRGEGCGGILLKRLSHALADGDNVVAVIRGSATNQDGRSIGLTAPNGLAQQAVIKAALANARTSPKHVSYIEAHGTGTALGDPIEMSALQEVFAPNRAGNDPLLVGSVKTNLGHLEGGAGIAGIIKTALALSKKTLPPHLHLDQPSTKIDWDWPVNVPKTLMNWPVANGHPRTAGVSSFGFGGSNAHVILEEFATKAEPSLGRNPEGGLLKISAKTKPALRDLVQSHLARLNEEELESLCYTSCVGRADFSHRIAIPTTTAAGMKHVLKAWLDGETPLAELHVGTCDEELRTTWVFPGRIAVDAAHTQDLYERHPRFRQEWDKMDALLQSFWPRTLSEIAWRHRQGSDADEAIATVAVQWIYAQLLLGWGLVPSRIVGQGLGELSGAAVAGLFSITDALHLASDPNYADRLTISQAAYPYQFVLEQGESNGSLHSPSHWRKAVTSSHHNPMPMEPPANSRGMMALVFGNPIASTPAMGDESSLFVLPMSPAEPEALLHLASKLYIAGAMLDWTAVFPTPQQKTTLPTYPFQRKSHWFTTRKPSERATANGHPLLASSNPHGGSLEVDLNSIPYLRNHRIGEMALCPMTFLLELALAGAAAQNSPASGPWNVSDLVIERPVLWNSKAACPLRATFSRSGQGMECRFQIPVNGTWTDSASCRASRAMVTPQTPPLLPENAVKHSIHEHYQRFAENGLTYEGEFLCLRSLMKNPRTESDALAFGSVSLPEECDSKGYFIHPALLDGCLQVAMTVLADQPRQAWMPVGVKDYRFYRAPESRDLVSIVRQIRQDESQEVQIDLAILDATNSVVAEVQGLTLRGVSYHADALLALGTSQSAAGGDEGLDRSEMDPSDRVPIFVKSRIAAILDLSPTELDLAQPLIDMGMDSIMAIELRNDILTEFQLELSMEELLDILTPQDLMACLMERLESQSKPGELAPRSDWVEGAI